MQCPSVAAEFVPVDHLGDARRQKRSRQAFYTPLPLVQVMVDTATHWPGCRVLEPSAGDGRIVWELQQRGLKVDVCETDGAMRDRCAGMGATIVGSDFLAYTPAEPYDLIVMNPPFAKGQDRRHIEHAWSMLAAGGELVAVCSPSLAKHLQDCTADLPGCEYAVYERLSAETFKASGTSIATLLVTLKRFTSGDCCGFTNHATHNAAVTIDSDAKLQQVARASRDPLEASQRLARHLADGGSSCYGVNWTEVLDYLKPDDAPAEPKQLPESSPSPIIEQFDLFSAAF